MPGPADADGAPPHGGWMPGLRAKIVLLTVALSFLTAMLIGTVAHVRTTDIAEETSTTRLDGEARVLGQRLDATLQSAAQDLLIVSRAPSVAASLGALQSPIGQGAPAADPRGQLAQHFSSILIARAPYLEVSLTGVWGGGTQIVAAQRTGAGLATERALAPLPDAPAAWLDAAAALGIGEVLVSLPPGDADAMRARISTPVAFMGSKIAVMSFLVDLRALFTPLLDHPDERASVLLARSDGTLQLASGAGWRVGGLPDTTDRDGVAAILSNGGSGQIQGGGARDSMFLSAGQPQTWLHGARFGAVLTSDRETLMAPARAAQRTTFLLTAGLCLLALTVSLYAAYRITRPLNALTRMIGATRDLDGLQSLPLARRDEIGALSRAFLALGERLRKSETGARAILDTVEDAIVVYGDDGVIRTANPAAARIFGADVGGLVGRDVRDVFGLQNAAAADLSGGIPDELVRSNAKGAERTLAVSLSRRQDRLDAFTTAVVRDVTEAREIEVRKADFIATVSHELRTPLTGIRSSLLLLRHAAGSLLPEKPARLLQLAIGNTDRLARLVDDILSAEKVASGKINYRLERLELGALLTDLIEANSALGHAHSVQFHADLVDAPLTVMLDKTRIEQVMLNLMSNAAKFSGDGTDVTLRLTRQRGNIARISVIDRGSGIPAEFRDRIFERFTRADSSTNAVQAGTGLGLNIARSMVEAMQGHLFFETETGRGTTFHADFPLCGSDVKAA